MSNTAGGTKTTHVGFMKQAITIRIDPELLRAAKLGAEAENRTLTNFVETVLRAHITSSINMSDAQSERRLRTAETPNAKPANINNEKGGHG
jgi:hypothetical protein